MLNALIFLIAVCIGAALTLGAYALAHYLAWYHEWHRRKGE